MEADLFHFCDPPRHEAFVGLSRSPDGVRKTAEPAAPHRLPNLAALTSPVEHLRLCLLGGLGFTDYRDPRLTEHSVGTLVRQRVMGITLGYEDLNDHDQLRHDPVLALLSGKLEGHRKDCAPLAGKSTLNRLEHAPPSGEPGPLPQDRP